MSRHRITHLTLAEAREALAKLGLHLSKKEDEYRVNFSKGKEKTAYYTDDLDDAVGTGKKMAKWSRSMSACGYCGSLAGYERGTGGYLACRACGGI